MTRIGYARVSTTDQDTAAQVCALRKAECSEIVTETASGADAARPELATLLDRVGAGDTLVVWKLDRLARSTAHLLSVAERLEAAGADLVCLTQPVDTTTPAGKLMFTILGAVAEMERELISERTKLGLEQARRRGRKLGRPRLPAVALDVARDQLRRGASVTQAAREAGISRAALYKHIPVAERDELRTRARDPLREDVRG